MCALSTETRSWKTLLRRTALVAVAGLALGACDDAGDPEGTASLTVLLTDNPGDVEHAWVEVVEVYLQGENGRTQLLDGSTGLINITRLAGGGTEAILTGVEVPAGTYAQLRFVLGDAAVQVDGEIYATPGVTEADLDGATGTIVGSLVCPSCPQTGLKVNLPGGQVTLQSGQQIVVVDFDVSQSFGRLAGRSEMWVMHPVLNGTEFTVTGSIEGAVALGSGVSLPLSCGGSDLDAAGVLGIFVPQATDGSMTWSGTTDGAAGTYVIPFVPPGSYDMTFDATVDFSNGDQLTFSDVTVDPAMVTVVSDAAATADYAIGSAVCTTP